MLTRDIPKIFITKKGTRSVNLGHPWIFAGEITKRDKIENGSICDVFSDEEKYLGTGFYNDNSKIVVRLLTRDSNVKINEDFFKRRIKYTIDYRIQTMGKEKMNALRIIHGESDGFPGLTVDKFNDIIVCQILSLGIEKNKDLILPNIASILTEEGYTINGIYERNDVNIRTLEGMEENKGWYGTNHPESTETIIEENGIKYYVDFENGQKTGFFLDQKFNRDVVSKMVNGLTVLDCCTHTGSFAMNAAKGNALKVVASDISAKALDDAKRNFELNGFNIDTIEADCFELLRELSTKKTKEFNFIIVDPPAFTKSRKTIDAAMRGYEELNYLAMKSLPRGGYLVTASCSHFASEELFRKSIYNAALKANVSLKQITVAGAAPDHPVLWGIDETEYLHFIIVQIV